MSKLNCNVVKDLLPNYIDHLTSEETNKEIEEHIEECKDCNMYYRQMKEEIDIPSKNIIERSEESMIRFLDKTKRLYLIRGIIWSFFALGILTCFIVDIAVNRKLTWSLIVDASIIYASLCIAIMIYCKQNKFLKSSLTGSLLLLPLLWCIKYTVVNILQIQDVKWFSQIALPITIIWLVIMWICIGVRYLLHANLWTVIGIMLILAIFGSAGTNAICMNKYWVEAYFQDYEWIDSISYAFSGIVCLVIGRIRKGKKWF